MYTIEKTRGTSSFKNFDYFVFIAVIFITAFGLIALYSATGIHQDNAKLPKLHPMVYKQIVAVAIGLIISLIISSLDYKDFKTLGAILYVASILLLILVLFIGTGTEKWNAKSWINIPLAGSMQPSELAKIAFIVIIAIFFERIKEGQMNSKDIIKLLILIGLPICLVLKQPDTGTAMVFMFILLIMMFICGLPYKYVVTGIIAFVLSLPLLWFFILKPFQKFRILVYLNPELDKNGRGFQVYRSKLTIGSGRIYGEGLGYGVQNRSNSVPIKESDFILTVIGQEFGLIGTMILLVLVFFLLIRCLYIASKARDSYGSFLVLGVTAMFAFHYFENISMCIGVLPVTGIPLPFISQGGSAMVTNYMAIGIVLSVSMRRKRTIFNSNQT